MAEIFVGSTQDRLPRIRTGKALRFFEYAPKPPLPTLATLARAAKQLPRPVPCALVCPRSTWFTPKGPMRPGPELAQGLDWIKRVSDILGAPTLVLATGAELTTGERDRTLLAAFVEQLKPTGRLIVVAPRGLWEAEHGSAFAQQAGCIYGFDPLEDDAPPGSVLYARVRPMGARPRLTDGHLAQIAERILSAQADTAYVAIDSAQGARDAKRLQKVLAELGEGFDPGEDEPDAEEPDADDGESDEDPDSELDGDEEPGAESDDDDPNAELDDDE